ncbi:hypothetical protein CKM354_000910400 [Cercospora kikuchii]|uniref:Uncharacterized protein n=1 Tax=Cercospora kikuchii TaxID=84275 RepID=A0A9P3FJT8_9PEZI|nr:uncharacterized protein CKM354_000910400 [Cercospora kikuchii]GIZ45959.1 hypothetical protein CKM354_000910400 [Cercospora kikuchii]
MVAFLLRKGADVNAQDGAGRTALHLCCKRGWGPRGRGELVCLEAIEILISHGAKFDVESMHSYTALSTAVRGGMKLVVQRLLQAGASANGSKHDWVETPLMMACRPTLWRSLAIVIMLIKHGADVNRCVMPADSLKPTTALANASEMSPHVTRREKSLLLCCLLVAGATPDPEDDSELRDACIGGDLELVEFCLFAGIDPSCLSDECIETLHGTRERRDKWSILHQHFPDTVPYSDYFDSGGESAVDDTDEDDEDEEDDGNYANDGNDDKDEDDANKNGKNDENEENDDNDQGDMSDAYEANDVDDEAVVIDLTKVDDNKSSLYEVSD